MSQKLSLAKVNRSLEIFWWVAAAITLVLVLIMCFAESWEKWSLYFLVPLLAALMALLRRFMGNKLKKSEAFKAAKEKEKN
ncbi:MAG: hypothetical protein MK078_04190 [Crocinitomicaceae bacterium]|nr:hypothetical protein [Crocinitomicaceae bacterium]